jgi:hypothetical protein
MSFYHWCKKWFYSCEYFNCFHVFFINHESSIFYFSVRNMKILIFPYTSMFVFKIADFYYMSQLIGSSSPYESNRASPTGGRRPLPFKRDLMGLSLSLSLHVKMSMYWGVLYIKSCESLIFASCAEWIVLKWIRLKFYQEFHVYHLSTKLDWIEVSSFWDKACRWTWPMHFMHFIQRANWSPPDNQWSTHNGIQVKFSTTELTHLVVHFQVYVMHSKMKWFRERTRKLYW